MCGGVDNRTVIISTSESCGARRLCRYIHNTYNSAAAGEELVYNSVVGKGQCCSDRLNPILGRWRTVGLETDEE